MQGTIVRCGSCQRRWGSLPPADAVSVRLTALPAELGTLTDLQELDLSYCKGLTALPAVTALPAEHGALTRLQKLVLSSCSGLTAMPAVLGALTDLQELDLGGQAGGGISVTFSDTEDGPLAELRWGKWQSGEFRATTGRQLCGEKWQSVLVGASDDDKLDVVFFIAVPTIWVKSAAKVEGRPLVRIIPSSLLTEYQGHHWLQKGRIVRSYILKRDAEMTHSAGALPRHFSTLPRHFSADTCRPLLFRHSRRHRQRHIGLEH